MYGIIAFTEVIMGRLIIDAKNVKKSFTVGEIVTDVLKDIDLQVEEGEFVAIVGESGSGKSTLLYILAGIDKPTAGNVLLAGHDLERISDVEMAALRRNSVSFVYQYDNLVPNLTARENIVLPLMLDKKKPSDYQGDVDSVCEYLGITEILDHYPKALSGGEQQRVALARALVTNPEIIFLDEPTGSLDKERGRQVMELLLDINKTRNVALVMVTHSITHSSYASRRIEIEDGRIK